jgi:hypothetical protein
VCWNQQSFDTGLCNSVPELSDLTGVNDWNSITNKYKDYTFVLPMDCSGDAFLGDVVRTWIDQGGSNVAQRGLKNAESVVSWLASQQQTGEYLSRSLSELLVMGYYTGAQAAVVWAPNIFSRIQSNRNGVVSDSGLYFIPTSAQGNFMLDVNFCSSSLVPASLQISCNAGVLTFKQLAAQSMSSLPSTPFKYIQSKFDATQLSILNSYLTSLSLTTRTQTQYYDDSRAIAVDLNIQPNFLTYIIESTVSSFSSSSSYTIATSAGATGGGTDPTVAQWVEDLPLTGTTVSRCGGSGCDDGLQSKEYAAEECYELSMRTHNALAV